MKIAILAISFVMIHLDVSNLETSFESTYMGRPNYDSNTGGLFQLQACRQMYVGSSLLNNVTLYAVFAHLCDPLGGGCGGALEVFPLLDGFTTGYTVRNRPGLGSTATCNSAQRISYQLRFEAGFDNGAIFIPIQYINKSGTTSGGSCCNSN